MQTLLPFRPWRFRDGDTASISLLTNPERKPDDRSPFVRYARAAAQWAEWVREGVLVQDEEATNPTFSIDNHSFKLAVTPIESITATMSVLPSASEPYQRLLEGLQVYTDPVVVVQHDAGLSVVANHEIFDAAKAYREEVARPGKVRSSDYCLVAIADPSYLDTVKTQTLRYQTHKPATDIVASLKEVDYAVSPRTDDPTEVTVYVEDLALTQKLEKGASWKLILAQAIGVKTLDLSSKSSPQDSGPKDGEVWVSLPRLQVGVLKSGTELPYGSVLNSIVPLSGAIMWSLRDFRTE